ncbi:hypothetical protein GCM10007921_38040 [Tritonibacter mobilis]|jgi:hypothetical protein|nr:hypothetical protein GCM10007921_38040 [Tritonibacter mobilis]SDX99100.1 hypothetical protein SAMN05444385_12013 [Tritonibacter mobilis]
MKSYKNVWASSPAFLQFSFATTQRLWSKDAVNQCLGYAAARKHKDYVGVVVIEFQRICYKR